MGFLHDIIFGQSSNNPEPQNAPDTDEQDWRLEEQRRWADRPLDSWATPLKDESHNAGEKVDHLRDASGRKIQPEVEIYRLKSKTSTDYRHLEVWASIKNSSSFVIELTEVSMLGYRVRPMRHLRPSESHELLIYRGDTPKSSSNHTAELEYNIEENGDYFQSQQYIEFSYEQHEGSAYYVPEECRPPQFVKDI